jgi:regulator of CtrA degradation
MAMKIEGGAGGAGVPIEFAERFAMSATFQGLFEEGMGLVEETAAYLDGIGRSEARELGRTASLSYASESMRLTTRLMQMASWLLLQRAVKEGELTQDQANEERRRVRLDDIRMQAAARRPDLPEALLSLVDRSVRLHERIRHLDAAMRNDDERVMRENPVTRDLGRLAAAFGRR